MNTQNLLNQEVYNNSRAVESYSKRNKLRKAEEIIFDKYLEKGTKILDIGCGMGRTSHHLADRGLDVTAIDYAELMVTEARKLYPNILFEVGDATQLHYNDASFEVVLFSFNGIDQIYPFSRREQALKEMYRVLKPGGLFIYSSHNFTARQKNLRRERGLFYTLYISTVEFLFFRPAFFEKDIYIISNTNEGTLTNYFGNLNKEKAHLLKLLPKLNLLEVTGVNGENDELTIRKNSATIYYVLRKNEI